MKRFYPPDSAESPDPWTTTTTTAATAHFSAQQPSPKQIRFVANDGLPHAKRRRISAACKTCRKRKTRCSGERPACTTCRQNGHECLGYADAPPPESLERERSGGDHAPDGGGYGYAASSRSTPRRASTQSECAAAYGYADAGKRIPERRISAPSACVAGYSTSAMGPAPEYGHRRPRAELDGGAYSPEGMLHPPSTLSERSHSSQHSTGERVLHRMPYFRWFGNTAIVPGYKQTFVAVELSSPAPARRLSVASTSSTHASLDAPPAYDALDGALAAAAHPAAAAHAVHPQVLRLARGFFAPAGLAGSVPFLREPTFVRAVERRAAAPVLANAVLGLAARLADRDDPAAGEPFLLRARARVVDLFACPSLHAVQACALLAYAEFAAARDSGLWVFAGLAIRLAQDLGLQKAAGVRGGGGGDIGGGGGSGSGAEPSAEAWGREHARREGGGGGGGGDTQPEQQLGGGGGDDGAESADERSATFWAVFFLDRVVSSGTGRPVTLRDDEIEVPLPPLAEPAGARGAFPPPFPALIRVIRLHGRATDLLNTTGGGGGGGGGAGMPAPELREQLARLQTELEELHAEISPRLHFSAANFQHYAKTTQASVFLLFHLWFHALIVVLNTGPPRGQRRLAMSSAKTIADMVAFAGLLDRNAVTANPFTSQPIYTAACAFLEDLGQSSQSTSTQIALQSYRNCYDALKATETYWTGVRYVLNVLDQKAQGVVSPTLFIEGGDSQKAAHIAGAVGAQGQSNSANSNGSDILETYGDISQAIGWSVAGTINSPSGNLAFLYPKPDPLLSYPSPHDCSQQAGLPIAAQILNYNQQAPGALLSPASESSSLVRDPQPDQLLPTQPLDVGEYPTHRTERIQFSRGLRGAPYRGDAASGTGDLGVMLESEDVNVNALGVDLGMWLGYLPTEGAFR